MVYTVCAVAYTHCFPDDPSKTTTHLPASDMAADLSANAHIKDCHGPSNIAGNAMDKIRSKQSALRQLRDMLLTTSEAQGAWSVG